MSEEKPGVRVTAFAFEENAIEEVMATILPKITDFMSCCREVLQAEDRVAKAFDSKDKVSYDKATEFLASSITRLAFYHCKTLSKISQIKGIAPVALDDLPDEHVKIIREAIRERKDCIVLETQKKEG